MGENRVIAILGCTASGKGELARRVALALGGEIVSVDSMKVYRRMDIGTAKPTAADRAQIPHHLIDTVEPWEGFSAARFVADADAAIAAIHGRGRPAIAVGGTVLYFISLYRGMFAGPSADGEFRRLVRARAAQEGVAALHAELARRDPAAASRIHPNDLRRVERALEVLHHTGAPISALQAQWDAPAPRRADWDWRLFGLRRDRDAANRRINDRVRRMMAAGLLEEVRALAADARGMSEQARQAVGYAELLRHLGGDLSLDDAVEQIKINSRRLAKQQRSWLKRFREAAWFELAADAETGEPVVEAVVRRAAQAWRTASE